MAKKSHLKFYIIDDDPETIELMTALLEAHGHRVLSNMSGAYAISEIVRNRPDCVLTDLMMAEVDGIDVCRELRARKELRELRVIMVSARREDYWKDRARQFGADGYITKPLDPESFVQQVEQIIATAKPTPGTPRP